VVCPLLFIENQKLIESDLIDWTSSIESDEKETNVLTKLREVLPGFRPLSGFVEQFSRTTKVASEIMKILKTKGLDQQSYEQCYQLTQTLPRNSKVGKRLRA